MQEEKNWKIKNWHRFSIFNFELKIKWTNDPRTVLYAGRDLHHSQPNRKEKFYKEFFSYILFSNQVLRQSGNHHPWRFFFRFLFSFGLHIGFSFSESLELSSLWQSPSAVDCAVEVDTGGGGDSTVTCLDVSSCGGLKTTWTGL